MATPKDAKPAAGAVPTAPKMTSKTPKVMDVVHPGQSAATPTSRPVLVTNRPMVTTDPMMAKETKPETTTDGAPLATPALSRQAKDIQPLTDGDTQTTEAPAEAIPAAEPEPAIMPPALPPEDQPDTVETEEPAEEPVTTPPSHAGGSTKSVLEPPTAAANPDEPAGDSLEAEPASAVERTEEPTSVSAKLEEADNSEEDEDQDIADTEEALRSKTAEQIRQEELEAHIQKGTYAVPINHVAKKRTVIVVTTLIILVLLVAMVDLLLDMGLIKMSGMPHTTFFSV